jgi:hypothetical protein
MTHEYWVNNQKALRNISDDLELKVSMASDSIATRSIDRRMCRLPQITAHLWPAFFPTYDLSKELAFQDCAMHKVGTCMTKQRPEARNPNPALLYRHSCVALSTDTAGVRLQDELSFLIVADGDDLLVDYNATAHFDAKRQIEWFFDQYRDCATLMTTWFEVAPDDEDMQRGEWDQGVASGPTPTQGRS